MAYTFPQNGVLETFSGTMAAWTNAAYGGVNMNISGGKAIGSDFTNGGSAQWGGGNYGPNSEAYCTISTIGLTGEFMYLHLRDSSSTSTYNGYRMSMNAFDGAWRIRRVDAGVTTLLASPSQAVANGDGVGFSGVGNTFTCWYKPSAGSWTALSPTATDSTYTAAGGLGLEADSDTYRMDDFGGGTITASLVPVRPRLTIYSL